MTLTNKKELLDEITRNKLDISTLIQLRKIDYLRNQLKNLSKLNCQKKNLMILNIEIF